MALKLGVNLGYWGIGPAGDDAAEMVRAAERLGYESAWAAESYGSDVVSVLAWLAAKGDGIQPVNSQTATCAIAQGGGDKGSQALVIALWYLDPPERKHGHH